MRMAAPSSKTETITQILYLNIPRERSLDQGSTHAGGQWAKALDIVTECPGFKKLYRGRRLEEAEKVQLHIGVDLLLLWRSVGHHDDYHHAGGALREAPLHRVILNIGVKAWTEYGHVVF